MDISKRLLTATLLIASLLYARSIVNNRPIACSDSWITFEVQIYRPLFRWNVYDLRIKNVFVLGPLNISCISVNNTTVKADYPILIDSDQTLIFILSNNMFTLGDPLNLKIEYYQFDYYSNGKETILRAPYYSSRIA